MRDSKRFIFLIAILSAAWIISLLTLLNLSSLRDDTERLLSVSHKIDGTDPANLSRLESEMDSLTASVKLNQAITFAVIPLAAALSALFQLRRWKITHREVE